MSEAAVGSQNNGRKNERNSKKLPFLGNLFELYKADTRLFYASFSALNQRIVKKRLQSYVTSYIISRGIKRGLERQRSAQKKPRSPTQEWRLRMIKNTRYWQFTWDSNSSQKKLPNKEKLKKYLNNTTDYCTFQIECGKLKSKLHYQGAFEITGSRLSKKQLLQRFEEVFGNVAGLTLTKARSMKDLVRYSTKEDTRVEGPFYLGKKEKFSEEFSDSSLNEWQQSLFDFIIKNQDNKILRDRKIVWVQDLVGNTGKSFFQKWLRIGQKQLVARKLPVSSVDRLISAVTKLSEQTKVDVYMINLTKTRGSDQSYDDLFATLEQIKDGFLVDVLYGKYVESIFDPPIVLVFTNESLANYTDKLTSDRWLGFQITNDKCIEYLDRTPEGVTPIKLKDFNIK